MKVDLSSVRSREALRPSSEPYWHRLQKGRFLGYRPSFRGGEGSWIARAYDEETKRYREKALGDFPGIAGAAKFAAAKKEAEAFAVMIETGGRPEEKVETVRDACREYLKVKPGSIAEGVFLRHVYDDPIAKVKLDRLRRHHMAAWRKRLEDAPALVSRSKTGEPRTKVRAASTVNRDMVPLRAALLRIRSPGAPGTDADWLSALKPIRGADGRRKLYLERDERKRLLAAADAEILPLLTAMCLLPLRPGALASLTVADWDKRTSALTIGKDKDGRPRQVRLPGNIGAFITEQVKGKLPGAPMFHRADGRAWNKDAYKGPIKAAVTAAKLPSGTSAYVLRHCVLTDLVRARLPVLTVAQISGTSVKMIEDHYGHLVGEEAAEALAGLVL
jgi:integrase